MADLSTNEIQEMTSESNTIQGSEKQQSAKIKKKVAMWVGYVGTHYKGICLCVMFCLDQQLLKTFN
jgi:hypothetical protein